MPEIPFHVAGGSFANRRAEALEAHHAPPAPAFSQMAKTLGSRRRKLWEIPHKFHCPVIGSCFQASELRTLMNKLMHLPRDTSDFVLHTTAVGTCETRSRLAEALHKTLEKRFHLTIKHYTLAKSAEEVRTLWHQAVQNGAEIPAALWAAWTHPACDTLLEQEIYGDIHMIQHQVGSGTRTDLKTLKAVREENAELRQLIEKARQEAEAARHEKAQETRLLGERIVELRAEQSGRDACIANLSAQLGALRDSLPKLKERQALARRADDAEARAMALTAQCRTQQLEMERLRTRLENIGLQSESPRQPVSASSLPDNPALAVGGDRLDGKCVLCVGGRTGAVDAYRDTVERHGGRFLHHDGGLEESLHRIDGVLAAADLVICQTGCISHNAYWRVKEQCKRTGKPCVYVRGSGVSAFGRALGNFGTPAGADGLMAESIVDNNSH